MHTTTRMDMHCHSSASSEPVVPWLGAWRVPESYSPPEKVYDQARARGMHLVTITDHDTIDGVLSLVHRGFQDIIIGEEVTTHFPEDRCRLHVLVWGLSPAQHEQIRTLALRDDVYHFAHWLASHNLAHALAHPLYSQNGKLTPSHLERCVLLFKAWESLNGAHASTHKDGVDLFLRSLTPARVQSFQRRHAMRALWMRPWQKAVTAGSDDHALLNVGRTWTEVEHDAEGPELHPDRRPDPEDFLRRVMAGRGVVRGQAGHSALLAHQIMAVTANHYAHAFSRRGGPQARALGAAVARMAGTHVPAPSRAALTLDAARATLRRIGIRSPRRPHHDRPPAPVGVPGVPALRPVLDDLARILPRLLSRHPGILAALRPDASVSPEGPAFARHGDMAAFLDDLTATLTASCASGLLRGMDRGDHADASRHLLTGLVALLAQMPTLYAMFHQNKERDLLTRLAHDASRHSSGTLSPMDRPIRVSLFTDTLGDVNGVCRFIHNVADQALLTGRDLQVITSTAMPVTPRPNVFNFDPVFHAKMPGYDTLDIVLPPLLRILRHLDEHQPDVVHISTPGPVGLVGLIAARMLRVPLIGVYHTDFPAYIDRMFDDFTFTSACEWAMRAFYGGFRAVFTRSADYEQSLLKLGIDKDRIRRLLPGLETARFNPSFFDPSLWRRIESESDRFAGLSRDSVKVLYVGRLSVEKNIGLLERAWKRVAERCVRAGLQADLILVGDGPARPAMELALRGRRAHFLGFRHAEELSAIYASSHLFVFPSVTDTLGQVVMESQASGLPVIVTDQGGPKEVVQHGVTGCVLPAHAPDAEDRWVTAMMDLIENPDRRARMGRAAAEAMKPHDIAHTFEQFWSAHADVYQEHLVRLGIRKAPPKSEHAPAPKAAVPAPLFDA